MYMSCKKLQNCKTLGTNTSHVHIFYRTTNILFSEILLLKALSQMYLYYEAIFCTNILKTI